MPLIVPFIPNIREDELHTLIGKYMIDDVDNPENIKDPGVPMDFQFVFFKSQLPEGVMVLPPDTYAERETSPNIVVDRDNMVIRVNEK